MTSSSSVISDSIPKGFKSRIEPVGDSFDLSFQDLQGGISHVPRKKLEAIAEFPGLLTRATVQPTVQSLVDRGAAFLAMKEISKSLSKLLAEYLKLNSYDRGLIYAQVEAEIPEMNRPALKKILDTNTGYGTKERLSEEDLGKIVRRLKAIHENAKIVKLNSKDLHEKRARLKTYLSSLQSPTKTLDQMERKALQSVKQDRWKKQGIKFFRDQVFIGRAPDRFAEDLGLSRIDNNHIYQASYISRFHAQLIVDRLTGLAFIEDVGTEGRGSRNGTYLNGDEERLKERAQIPVVPGDYISLANPVDRNNSIHIVDLLNIYIDDKVPEPGDAPKFMVDGGAVLLQGKDGGDGSENLAAKLAKEAAIMQLGNDSIADLDPSILE